MNDGELLKQILDRLNTAAMRQAEDRDEAAKQFQALKTVAETIDQSIFSLEELLQIAVRESAHANSGVEELRDRLDKQNRALEALLDMRAGKHRSQDTLQAIRTGLRPKHSEGKKGG